MADVKVELPSPCSEPWEAMTPIGCNRHCAACDKTIHDLSRLTLEQAEQLLDSAEEVCVRAQIDSEGVVRLADGGQRRDRRMVATIGASLALATAACTTVPAEEKLNRFAISGTVPYFWKLTKPVIRSSDGQEWRVQMEYKSTSFVAPDLFPGVYSITYEASCGEGLHTIENVVIRDRSVDLGQLEGDGQCIIVGVMMRQDGFGRM